MCFSLTHPLLTLRPITDTDGEVLRRIYWSTREKEMLSVPHWTAEQKRAFLEQQFTAQHSYYSQHYTGAIFALVLAKDEPIGRLYLSPQYTDGSLRIIDITILPGYRNKGYGESLLRDVITYATTCRRSVTIHVESFNPAKSLYERLGFVLKDRKNEVYHLLERPCAEALNESEDGVY